MRFQAEKQIEIALQKVHDMEKRVEDWQNAQESNLNHATDVIGKLHDGLYKKFASLLKNKSFSALENNDSSQIHKESLVKLEELLKSLGLVAKSNYFMSYMIPPEFRKSVPCDAFIIFGDKNCAIIDLKITKLMFEFERNIAVNNSKADNILKEKLDRYLIYLSNPKYRGNVVNYFAEHKVISPKASVTMVMLLGSEAEIIEIKENPHYSPILQKAQIRVYSFDSLAELIGNSGK